MSSQSDKRSSNRNQPRSFLTGLRFVRGFVSRLISLVSLTQQDLKDAGVIHSSLYN